MIEDSNGEYKQSTVTTFPGYEYFYNQEKSTCMDMSGNPVENSVLYDQDNKKVTITIGDSSSCYLYFDKYKSTSFSDGLIASGNLWQSGLEGDGYRFAGSFSGSLVTNSITSLSNFICFGTTDKDTCTSNPSTYMYRIIGVFVDENGDNHVKLIKYTQLSTAYAWHSSHTDADWADSDLYKGLNGSYFLTNTTYSYMQDNTWLNKITDWKWSAVNTKTYESSGPDYYDSLSPSNIYLHEMNRSAKPSTIGEWTTPTAKIGLMYASDYALSLGSTALAMTTGINTNRNTLKTGWMHQSNNDTTASVYEWTISRAGVSGSSFRAWYVDSAGFIYNYYVTNTYGVRPVFYLESDVIAVGQGALDDPYIIFDETGTTTPLKVSLSNSGSTLTATITKGTGNLNKYCINTSSSITNCTWNNITSTLLTYIMPSEGTYYVHVIDDVGYIAHDLIVHKHSCSDNFKTSLTFSANLINECNLWNSGLNGDGYRFVGTGITCSYESGTYQEDGEPTCQILYNVVEKNNSTWRTSTDKHKSSCPNDNSSYTYSCDMLLPTIDSSNTPNNFLCFGTTDKDTCIANMDTYMYRIIGVFNDGNGNKYVKLIKYKQLSSVYKWHSSNTDTDWSDSDLYKGLNGSYFLTNTSYSYMQDSIWLNKITDWEWHSINTLTRESSGTSYTFTSPKGIYQNEILRANNYKTTCANSSDSDGTTSRCGIGELDIAYAKIGLMYASDYALSLGDSALAMTTGTSTNNNALIDSWMHPSNNDTTVGTGEFTIARIGGSTSSGYYIWSITAGTLNNYPADYAFGVRPVFYLTSDVKSSSGTGTISDPYILDIS